MPSQFSAITNKEVSQIIKPAVPELLEEGEQSSVWKFQHVKPCSFLLEFIDEMDEKVCCLQMQIKSCITLFSWHVLA